MATFEITKLSTTGHVKVRNVDTNKYYYYAGNRTTAKIVNNTIVIDPENDDTHVSINVVDSVDTIVYSGTSSPFTGTADNPVDHCDFLNTYCFFDPAGSSGPGGTLPAGTQDKSALVWDDTTGEWKENIYAQFGHYRGPGAPTLPLLSGQITCNHGYFRYGNNGFQWITYPYIIPTVYGGVTNAENTIYRNTGTGNVTQRRVVETSSGGSYFNLDQETFIADQGNDVLFEKLGSGSYRLDIQYATNERVVYRIRPLDFSFDVIDAVNSSNFRINSTEVKTTVNGSQFLVFGDGVTFANIGATCSFSFLPLATQFTGINYSSFKDSDYASFSGANYSFFIGAEATYSTLGIGYIVSYLNGTIALGGYIGANSTVSASGVDAPTVLYSTYDVNIGIDPSTTVHPVNSLGLGGKSYTVVCPNTAYMSGTAERFVCLDAGGTGYTLDMDNDPICGVVLLTDVQADFLYLPIASERYLHLSIVVKKIGANPLTIDETAGGTLEQVGGGFGATYVLNAVVNSQVTLKCVLVGANYYWIVY